MEVRHHVQEGGGGRGALGQVGGQSVEVLHKRDKKKEETVSVNTVSSAAGVSYRVMNAGVPHLRLPQEVSVLDGEILSGAEGELRVLGEGGGDLQRGQRKSEGQTHTAKTTGSYLHGAALTSMIRYSTGRGRARNVTSFPNLSLSC